VDGRVRRVHECVFGVLALESEPVGARLWACVSWTLLCESGRRRQGQARSRSRGKRRGRARGVTGAVRLTDWGDAGAVEVTRPFGTSRTQMAHERLEQGPSRPCTFSHHVPERA